MKTFNGSIVGVVARHSKIAKVPELLFRVQTGKNETMFATLSLSEKAVSFGEYKGKSWAEATKLRIAKALGIDEEDVLDAIKGNKLNGVKGVITQSERRDEDDNIVTKTRFFFAGEETTVEAESLSTKELESIFK